MKMQKQLVGLSLILLNLIACAVDDADDQNEAAAALGDGQPLAQAEAALSSRARHYTCGYALPGYACDNGRNHAFVTANDLTSAIAACQAAQLSGYTDFCYVADADGPTATDVAECSSTSASWRPGNSCCNFEGTLSCPQTRHYTCGYALPGYNCNNGRTHAFVDAEDMSAAIAACHTVQPSQYSDFCYVADATGGTSADVAECSSASASWRPGNSCCNFKGTLSCPG